MLWSPINFSFMRFLSVHSKNGYSDGCFWWYSDDDDDDDDDDEKEKEGGDEEIHRIQSLNRWGYWQDHDDDFEEEEGLEMHVIRSLNQLGLWPESNSRIGLSLFGESRSFSRSITDRTILYKKRPMMPSTRLESRGSIAPGFLFPSKKINRKEM